MHVTQYNLIEDSSPEFCAGRKVSEAQKAHLWKLLNEEPQCPSRIVIKQIAESQGEIGVSVRQINRLRVNWKLNRGKGRPGRGESGKYGESGGKLVKMTPHVRFIGVHLLEAWMEQQEGFGGVLKLLKQGIEAYRGEHPEEEFALLHHREQTLLVRFKALFYAPLLGIGRLSELDVKEHGLESLIGRGYQSTTLNQFLGQLERIDAGEALMPAMVPAQAGKISYVDGHLIGYWSRVSMHKGKITMLGRIMAGSQAVVAHNEGGEALYVAYHPPDIRLPHVIVNYCEKVVSATGIRIFVIDREVNSVELAREFESKQLGLLSMLDKNEYDGLWSWQVTWIGELEDGSVVYKGKWKQPREGDPRRFVIVKEADRVLVYWGTSLVEATVEPVKWPGLYRERSDIQENSFKRMIDHGALNINYGRKKIVGPDRHQLRVQEKVEQSLKGCQQKVETKQAQLQDQHQKVAESKDKGHSKRLEQRQQRLGVIEAELKEAVEKERKLKEELDALGSPKERADRDFRKQTIMTFRTLLLENTLLCFLMALWGKLTEKVSRESIMSILFERSGYRLETDSEILYGVNSAGLSAAHKETLGKVVEGLCAMNLKHQGKPIRVRLREAPS